MRKLFLLFTTIVLLTACTNSTTTGTEDSDTATMRDNSTYGDTTNVETNTVTPPASNGQF